MSPPGSGAHEGHTGCPGRWNPIRDAAAYIELGERARDALSSPLDWNEVIAIWAFQQDLPPELIARATGHADAWPRPPVLNGKAAGR